MKKQIAPIAPADPRTACLDEINAVLAKYGCDLVPVPEFKPDGRGGWTTFVTITVTRRVQQP